MLSQGSFSNQYRSKKCQAPLAGGWLRGEQYLGFTSRKKDLNWEEIKMEQNM
jgi:hypothetical protein